MHCKQAICEHEKENILVMALAVAAADAGDAGFGGDRDPVGQRAGELAD